MVQRRNKLQIQAFKTMNYAFELKGTKLSINVFLFSKKYVYVLITMHKYVLPSKHKKASGFSPLSSTQALPWTRLKVTVPPDTPPGAQCSGSP